jgi:methylmalonyl-CoA mutase cobalamin-binding domain/chain
MHEEILKNLGNSVLEFDSAAAEKWARQAMEANVDPIAALGALTDAIRIVGDLFEKGEYFLPELVTAADVMQKAVPILEARIQVGGEARQSLGTVVIGTVFGDIHSIGKTMVSTLLSAEGFHVIDVGVNAASDKFIQAVVDNKADLVAMSALMTMTIMEQKKVIEQFEKEGVRKQIKVMVGGSAITAQIAKEIGADGYEPTAPGAVRLARKLLGK